ncbi:MAG: Asp-tRNA(Asn)/Glu-tRNA(Gln) amidotransferase subunit GatB, partial [Devosia sp.]
QAVRTGLGLNAAINKRSLFDRKNYFYPDLPQGYQISQYKDPIVGEGKVRLDMGEGTPIEIGIERLHLEQDAGKSIHDQHPNLSFVDLNRSGVALMEIVSKPDLRSSEEAKTYLSKLRTILRYLGTCDGNMEQGSMRADVNVSVRRPGGEFGTRCEIKNVNSVRFAGQAIEYEARRQIDILEDGGSIDQETRLYDPKTGETRSMRSKEEAHDYRYFPDPDLLPLEFDQAFIDELARHLPELPDEKQARFIRDYGVTAYDAMVLTLERETADYYEAAVRHGSGQLRDGKAVANLLTGDIAAYANSQGLSAWETHIQPGQVAGIVDLVAAGTISGKIAKDLLHVIIAEEPEGDPAEIVERRGMKQVTDLGAIERVVDEIIAANPDQVAKVLAKPTLIGWFVGQAMKASGGKANPQALNDILKKKLGL